MGRLLVVLALSLAACGGDEAPAVQVDDVAEESFDPADVEARVTELESQMETLEGVLAKVLASSEALEIPDTSDIEGQLENLQACVRSIKSWVLYDRDSDYPILGCGGV